MVGLQYHQDNNMAVELQRKFSVDLSIVVNNAIDTVRTIRKKEQAIREAEFQKAIESGLSYEEQVEIRKAQLEEEKKSNLSDEVYIASLEKSIAETKRLSRFNKYRTRYTESLGSLSAGKINEEQHLSILKVQLSRVTNPILRLEIQGDIAGAERGVKDYNDTILKNQVNKAKSDKTVSILEDVISRVTVARTNASINNNQDEVTAHDETLSALNSQLNGVRVENAIQDFEVKSNTRGTDAIERLEFINSEIRKAESDTPIRIDGKPFTSIQQFWSIMRDDYLSGAFFVELDRDIKNNILVNSRLGMSQSLIDGIKSVYDNLRAKPEMAPFLLLLDAQAANTMNDVAGKYAGEIVEVGSQNRDYDNADIQLQNLSKRFGVDLTVYQLALRNRNIAEVGAGKVEPGKIEALPLPEIGAGDKAAPITPVAPTVPVTPATPVTPTEPIVPSPPNGIRTVRAGDTLSDIANEFGIGLNELIELNPQFKENPDLIQIGQEVNIPSRLKTTKPVEVPEPEPIKTTTPLQSTEDKNQTLIPKPEPIQTKIPKIRSKERLIDLGK